MIVRDVKSATDATYDLIIIGGGIHGVALALQAARRGLRVILLEQDDFGGATSWNSLRIVHGGLRYLQSLDLTRFRESVSERNWLLRTFPEHVKPLACLMPLYGRGLRRASVLRVALGINNWLSWQLSRELRSDQRLSRGKLLNVEETRVAFPGVELQGLQGAAQWFDGVMPNSQRLLIEMLRWACSQGARALNYTKAVKLLQDVQGVRGVRIIDAETGGSHELRAPCIVNAAGPWCRDVARQFDRDEPRLFRPSLAVNLLLNRSPLTEAAVALSPPRPEAGTYFLYPWQGLLLAGTFHMPWGGSVDETPPSAELVNPFLERLNAALPSLDLDPGDVLRVYWGFLPAKSTGLAETSARDVIINHGALGGPKGLFSVSGVKFTTARRVAEKTLRATGLAGRPVSRGAPPSPRRISTTRELQSRLQDDRKLLRLELEELIREESVVHFEDLNLRRTDWGVVPSSDLEQDLKALLGSSTAPAQV